MTPTEEDRRIFDELEHRLRKLLPEVYQDRYDDVRPVSMGSAGLQYGSDGRVAWNEIWQSFCDLAMAGGPPHKGTLLEPASPAEIAASPDQYASVVAEICRGITMVTQLEASSSPTPGWVRVECLTPSMAAWLLRAITIENVAVRADGVMVDLPAGPAFRIEKEIKNVITVVAKTTHYWTSHMSLAQKWAIANLLDGMHEESPLVEPVDACDDGDTGRREALRAEVAAAVHRSTSLARSPHRYAGWLGFECPNVRSAVWMMRMMVAVNVLSRREQHVLFVPINPATDPAGDIVADSVSLVHRLGQMNGTLLGRGGGEEEMERATGIEPV